MAAQAEVMFNPFELILNKLESIQAEIATLKQVQTEAKVEKFLTAKQVCEILQISQPTRSQLAKTGRLIPMRVGRKLLYSERSVQEALKNYSKWDRM